MSVKSITVGIGNIRPKLVKLILPAILSHVTFIFNTIITQSTFPQNWKYAKVIPIPKSNNEYRPIAIIIVIKYLHMLSITT